MEALTTELWASLAVIIFIIGMAIFMYGWVKKKMKEDGENNR